jgi:endonuclease-3
MSTEPLVEIQSCGQIDELWRRLADTYGHPRQVPTGDPLGQLVVTILSQHTTDASADRACENLRATYPEWSQVAEAPVEDVAVSIKSAGLSRQKASTIQNAIRELSDDSLALLANLPVPEARSQLTALRGIGDKTASCVLLFALGMPAQPVDTHIERVSKRLGVASESASATRIQNLFESCLPPDGQTMFAFHVDLIRHGRQVCTARAPKCSICTLSDMCAFFAQSAVANA